MNVIDEILNEWSYRCHDGIVDVNDPKKLRILKEILDENGINLNEDENASSFEKQVLKRYIAPLQKINGLKTLHKAIAESPNSEALFNLINNSGGKVLKSEEFSIKGIDKDLYYLINNSITIPNGNPSELWFAIMYDGKVVGGVKSEETGDAAADIAVGGQTISLKNYSSAATIDLGTLPSETIKSFSKLLNFLSTVTATEIDATLPVSSLNNVLAAISDEDVNDFLEFAKDSSVKWIKNQYDYVKSNSLERIKEKFVEKLNENILNKVNKVTYWVAIIGDNVYAKESTEVADKLTSNIDKISSAISSLKGYHLFVNGNVLFLGKKKGSKTSQITSNQVDILKPNYKNLTSGTTKLQFASDTWIKNHPEYAKFFDDTKRHPLDKNYFQLKPDAKIELTPTE